MRFGALKLPHARHFAVRLREIHFLISGLVEQFAPDAVAVESVFTALNMRTALKLAEMRGVVLLAAAQAQIPAHSYSPREVKASVAGFGAASKQQVQQMVRSLLDLPFCPEPVDASDALAVALCHAQMQQTRERWGVDAAAATAPRTRTRIRRIPVWEPCLRRLERICLRLLLLAVCAWPARAAACVRSRSAKCSS